MSAYSIPGATRDTHSAPSSAPPTSVGGREQGAVHGHAQDLGRICKARKHRAKTVNVWARRNIVVAFISYLLKTARTFLWTLLVSPATFFTDPLSTVFTLFVYPVIALALAAVVFVLYIGSLLGARRAIKHLSQKYAGGFGPVNWADPTIFGPRSLTAITDARATLAGEVETTVVQQAPLDEANPDFTALKTIRLFSLPLARAFLLMSSLAYERDDHLIDKAAHVVESAQGRFGVKSPEYAAEMKRAEVLIGQSERLIKNKAAEWGLEFDGVSDLTSVGGPFASIFYTLIGSEKPFICLVFKGTTPTRFQEWLVDTTITKTSASVFFGPGSGSAHAGFYSDLFVTNDPGSGSGGDGYGSIVRTLRHVAQRMKQAKGSDAKIPLWGHSLGSALASLCYARFLRSEEDLGPDLQLRDAYCYGTPRLGDGEFASAFEQTLVTPLDRKNILWRVRNNLDIVTMVPPGLGDNESTRNGISSGSVLNYAWLGAAIRLRPASFPWRMPFYSLERVGAFHEAVDVQVVDVKTAPEKETESVKAAMKLKAQYAELNPVVLLTSLLPAPLYNHLPASYLQHLDNAYTTVQQEAAERIASVDFPIGRSGGRLKASLVDDTVELRAIWRKNRS